MLKNLINRFKHNKLIDLNKFQEVSKSCINEPSKTYEILNKEFSKEMRKIAVKQINNEKNLDLKNLSVEDKEHLIAEREKELWSKVKNGGLTTFALITGITLG
tara:strand:+ start:331 stop:639 length:309 start_codon:yes stop_codon:yes gene_type:complete